MQEKKELKELKEEDIEKVSGGTRIDNIHIYCYDCQKHVEMSHDKVGNIYCSECHGTNLKYE